MIQKKFRSISTKVLTIILIVYIASVCVLTITHFAIEYYQKKEALKNELFKTADAFYPALQKALWDMDEDQIDLILHGIMKISIIQGIEVFDKFTNQPIKTIFAQDMSDVTKKDFFHQVDIFKYSLDSKEYLATINFFSNSEVILNQIKDGFFLMLINSLIKSILLIGLLIYLIKRHITRPLKDLTSEVEKIDLSNKDVRLVKYNPKVQDELSILRDSFNEMITKNKQQEEHMQSQAKLAQMGEMIKMIAHQWRQPLSAISSTAAVLDLKITMGKYDKEFFSEQVTNISTYSSHLSSTIDDFRNFFKTNKIKQDITLKNVVKDSLNILGNSLKNKNISLKSKFNCEHIIHTYPNELKQVVLNLIKNAEDALVEKNIENATIWITTLDIGENCVIEVKDNAGGIDTNIMTKIFDPYFTTKSKRDGTGLGLYMSKTIIEKHCDGELKVYNDLQGAVFTIALRRIDE